MKKIKKKEEAAFGAGCFWHIEEVFYKIPGVIETEVGYMGGKEKEFPKPTYEKVCSNKTGYIEVVHLKFNPSKITYEKLLNIFWKSHDPASMDKQGADVGVQYKSVIFYYSKKQKELAEKYKRTYEKEIKRKIVTKIIKAPKFFKAEEYHQKYFIKSK